MVFQYESNYTATTMGQVLKHSGVADNIMTYREMIKVYYLHDGRLGNGGAIS